MTAKDIAVPLYQILSELAQVNPLYLGCIIRDLKELMDARKDVELTPQYLRDWWRGHLQISIVLEDIDKIFREDKGERVSEA